MVSTVPGALVALLLFVPACGGSVVFDEADGEGDGSGGASATSSTSASPPTSSTSGQGGEDAIMASAVATVGSGGGTEGDVVPTTLTARMGANCMPEVGEDPIFGSVVVLYQNFGSSPGSLDELRAEIAVVGEVEGWIFPIELSPTTSGLVPGGATVEVEHVKVATGGDSSFICSLCGLEAGVALHWIANDGTTVTTSAAFELECAF